jgi:hypothetical protein
MPRWKLVFLRSPVFLFQLALDVIGRIPGARYARFLSLDRRAKRAVEHRRYQLAENLARELLQLADVFRANWNYGNALHHAHIVLGRVALAAGDITTAREELLLAGHTPGSPQLDSFGPNMALAVELLRAGERDAVQSYLGLCGKFWRMERGLLAYWGTEIEQGREPNVGPNLHY